MNTRPPCPLAPDNLLSATQVAALLGISPRTLAAWRSSRKRGPGYLKCGSRVRYQKQTVADWLAKQSFQGGTNE